MASQFSIAVQQVMDTGISLDTLFTPERDSRAPPPPPPVLSKDETLELAGKLAKLQAVLHHPDQHEGSEKIAKLTLAAFAQIDNPKTFENLASRCAQEMATFVQAETLNRLAAQESTNEQTKEANRLAALVLGNIDRSNSLEQFRSECKITLIDPNDVEVSFQNHGREMDRSLGKLVSKIDIELKIIDKIDPDILVRAESQYLEELRKKYSEQEFAKRYPEVGTEPSGAKDERLKNKLLKELREKPSDKFLKSWRQKVGKVDGNRAKDGKITQQSQKSSSPKQKKIDVKAPKVPFKAGVKKIAIELQKRRNSAKASRLEKEVTELDEKISSGDVYAGEMDQRYIAAIESVRSERLIKYSVEVGGIIREKNGNIVKILGAMSHDLGGWVSSPSLSNLKVGQQIPEDQALDYIRYLRSDLSIIENNLLVLFGFVYPAQGAPYLTALGTLCTIETKLRSGVVEEREMIKTKVRKADIEED